MPVSSPLPGWQPSVSLRESLLVTALPTRWSWCIWTLMVHTADLWACWVHSNNTCCMCLRPGDSLMRMYPQPVDSRSKCQDAAAATRAVITGSLLAHTEQHCQRQNSNTTVRADLPQNKLQAYILEYRGPFGQRTSISSNFSTSKYFPVSQRGFIWNCLCSVTGKRWVHEYSLSLF